MGLGITLFVVALLASILIHELGHLLTAKHYGMKATQYFLGFGPTLWSTRRGETEYGVKAVPAGGFVKIVGMTQLEDLEPEDEPRAFWRQPARRRFVVLVAGSTMHFLIAIVLIPIAFFGWGDKVETLRVAQVTPCVVAHAGDTCKEQDPPSPAKLAGLRPGDELVSLDGQQPKDWESFTRLVRAHPAGPATLVVRRDGQLVTLHPKVVLASRRDPDPVTSPERPVGQLGVVPALKTERPGLVQGFGNSAKYLWGDIKGTWLGIVRLPAAVPKAFGAAFRGDRRDENGAVGLVGIGRVSGQVFQREGVPSFLLLIAGLNVFIGAVNLLPLLPLDGGHIAILLFEKARSRTARLLGRPDPGRVDLRKLMPVAAAVVVILVGLTVVLLFADIGNPIQLPGG